MRRMACMLVLLVLLVAADALAQNGTRVENAFRGVMQDRWSHSAAEALFVEKCGMCHREMGMGTVLIARRSGPEGARLERRPNLTVEMIRSVVRGGLGNMPRLSRGEVSDADLDIITRYLVAPRPAPTGSP